MAVSPGSAQDAYLWLSHPAPLRMLTCGCFTRPRSGCLLVAVSPGSAQDAYLWLFHPAPLKMLSAAVYLLTSEHPERSTAGSFAVRSRRMRSALLSKHPERSKRQRIWRVKRSAVEGCGIRYLGRACLDLMFDINSYAL